MRRRDHLKAILLFGAVLSLAGALLAQDAQDAQETPAPAAPEKVDKTFVVNGRTMTAPVVQVAGRSYVDIESLAQITNGVVTIGPDRIIVAIAASSAPTSSNAGPSQSVPGMSRDFVTASIGSLAEMREWRGAVETMVTYGLAVSGAWAQGYHDRAEDDLTQATVAAATESDHNALVLLRNEFDRLSGWAGDTVAARQALNGEKTIDPNSLSNDQTLAKITNCGQFLSAMLVSGVFADDASCH